MGAGFILLKNAILIKIRDHFILFIMVDVPTKANEVILLSLHLEIECGRWMVIMHAVMQIELPRVEKIVL